jgi:carboxylesterase type B
MAQRLIIILITLLLATLLTSASPRFQPYPVTGVPRVDLNYTKYVGRQLANGVNEFLGMRYAAAPLGNLRWRAPVEPRRTNSVEAALKFQPVCLGNGVQYPFDGEDEDCLFVNVWTPTGATVNSRLPVWVFIQGGGMFMASFLPFR